MAVYCLNEKPNNNKAEKLLKAAVGDGRECVPAFASDPNVQTKQRYTG
jgi:hypothetical protein